MGRAKVGQPEHMFQVGAPAADAKEARIEATIRLSNDKYKKMIQTGEVFVQR